MSDERRALARAAKQHVEGLRAFGLSAVPSAPVRYEAPEAVVEQQCDASAHERLERLAREVAACQRCPLYRTATQEVVSDGTPTARLMFIGEAPGRDEDLQGKPFVGRAGQLLTKMIEAMGMKREQVYICNVLKHRPPGNRVPLPEEMDACFPYLQEQIAVVKPKVICTLGAVATKALLGPYVSITKIRGEVREYQGTMLVPTFHPAYLLRNPPAKKYAWEDLKKIKQLLATGDR